MTANDTKIFKIILIMDVAPDVQKQVHKQMLIRLIVPAVLFSNHFLY